MPLFVEIKVKPSSGKQKCVAEGKDALKCFLKSPPEKGRANAELIKFLSKKLKIPQNNITIVSGATSRKKQLKIDTDISFDQLCQKLDIQRQTDLTEIT